jgi:hypothetical protein
MLYKKIALQIIILSTCIALALHAELPLTKIKGLAEPFRGSIVTEQLTTDRRPATAAALIAEQKTSQEDSVDDNIFSPIYGALAWHSPYLLNLWQLDSESATANLVHQLFNLQFDGVTFDISGIPGNTISHLSCENLGYIIGLLYNYEQAMNAYQKQVDENTALVKEEELRRKKIAQQEDPSRHEAQQGEDSPRQEQRTPSPQGNKVGKKSPRPTEKQREFSKYKNEEPLRIKKELTDKLTAYLDTLSPALIKHNIVTYYTIQLAHLDADIAREQDQAKIQALQRKKADLESKLVAEQSSDSNTITLRSYSEGKNSFVNDVVNSMLDTRYLPHNTTLLLLACMWKKANSFEDIMQYLYGVYTALDNKTALFTDTINDGLKINSSSTHLFEAQVIDIPSSTISYQAFNSVLMPIITQQPYTAAEYQKLITTSPTDLYKNLADYTFAFLGFDIFGDPTATLLPPEVTMIMKTQYGETTFPDCGETSLLNFFAAVLYNPLEKNWNHQLLDAINADQKLKKFFHDFSPSTLNTQHAHNRWAQVLSGKAGVDYTRANRCEINAGIDNMLKVIAALVPGVSTFDDLARILNSNGVQINFKTPAQPNQNFTTIPITLTKNDTKLVLEWLFNPGHFHLSFPPKAVQNDPRPMLLHAMPFNIARLTDVAIQALLAHYNNNQIITNYYQAFLYGIQDPKLLLQVVGTITQWEKAPVYTVLLLRSLYNALSKIQLPDDDQEMYQEQFWRTINTALIPVENIVSTKNITTAKDILKPSYLNALLSQSTAAIENIDIEKIKDIITTIHNEKYRWISIGIILRQDQSVPIVQQLYKLITSIIPPFQDDELKTDFIEIILQKDPTIPAVAQLYKIIKQIIPTIEKDYMKRSIILAILKHDPINPIILELYNLIEPMLSTTLVEDGGILQSLLMQYQKNQTIPVLQRLHNIISPNQPQPITTYTPTTRHDGPNIDEVD